MRSTCSRMPATKRLDVMVIMVIIESSSVVMMSSTEPSTYTSLDSLYGLITKSTALHLSFTLLSIASRCASWVASVDITSMSCSKSITPRPRTSLSVRSSSGSMPFPRMSATLIQWSGFMYGLRRADTTGTMAL